MKEDQASSTALLIAASLSFLGRQRQTGPLVSREACELGDWLMQHYSSFTRGALSCLDQAWFRGAVRGLERLTIPHMVEHYAQRKRAIESLVRERSQTPQLVVLGAGFDTLSVRMVKEFAGLRAYELDHPATQAWKKRAVAACDFDSPRLSFLAQDLAVALPVGFGERHRKDEETFWVAEGFLMYFSAAKVEEIFQFIRQASAPRSRVAFTFMEPQGDGRVDFRRSSRGVRLWLAQRREPFAWGIRRDDLSSFLYRQGFKLLEIPGGIVREVDRLNVGEYLALAEVR